MRQFDLSPLFRSSVGFDQWSDLLDRAFRVQDNAASYPPYNIEKRGENSYRITMAVAGFAPEDIDITAQENAVIIRGQIARDAAQNKADNDDEGSAFLYRGIAERAFERQFHIADYVKVKGADMKNGLLHIYLEREVPEALKPRKIEIGSGGDQLEGKTLGKKLFQKSA